MKPGILLFLLLSFCIEINAQFVQTTHIDTAFTSYFRQTEAGTMTSGDGGMSVKLPDGRTVWLISDSYISAVNLADTSLACLFDINNCIMVQEADDESEFTTIYNTEATGIARTFFRTSYCPGGNDRFWPVHGYVAGEKLFVFLHRFLGGNMEFTGTYLAQVSIPTLAVDSISEISQTDILWGHYVLPNQNGDSLYIYGTRKNWITFDNYLARCPINGVYGQWQYFTGTGWSSNPTNAGKIQLATPNVFGNGMSVLPIQGRYYMFLQENGFLSCGLGRNINVFRSDNPWGPFNLENTIYTIKDSYADTFMITYQTFAHAQFTRNDEVLLSYAVNDVCPTQCQNIWTDTRNADTYRLKFIRAPFNVIDPELQLNLDSENYLPAESKISVYPNPFSDVLNIEFSPSKPLKSVSFYSSSGNLLYFNEFGFSETSKKNIQVNLGHLPGGIYLAKFQTDESVIIRKVVKW
jgi:hypothetical protein